jgi:hypothetical protein
VKLKRTNAGNILNFFKLNIQKGQFKNSMIISLDKGCLIDFENLEFLKIDSP